MEGRLTRAEIEGQGHAWRSVVQRATGSPVSLLADRIAGPGLFSGSGSSYYLAGVAAATAEVCTGTWQRVSPAAEVVQYPTGLPRAAGLYAFSRSGSSTEIVRATGIARDAGVPSLAVTAARESSLAQTADHALVVPEATEASVVMTRSFTSMLIAWQAMLLRALHESPETLNPLWLRFDSILDSAWAWGSECVGKGCNRAVILGAGPLYWVAREGALKLQEMALIDSEAYPPLEYRHGPRSQAGEATLVVLLASDSGVRAEEALLAELALQGARVAVVEEDQSASFQGTRLRLGTGLSEAWRAAAATVPLQVLALAWALARGEDPDHPTHLGQVVELGAETLPQPNLSSGRPTPL